MELRKDEVRKKLERELKQTEARIENWQRVTRTHKKDGGDFANIWRNFDVIYTGHEYSDSIEVHVPGSYPDYNMARDFIMVKTENLTADDVENAIKGRIEQLKKHKETIRDNLGVMDNLYDETIEELTIIKDRKKEIAGNRTPLFYIMLDVVEKHYYRIDFSD